MILPRIRWRADKSQGPHCLLCLIYWLWKYMLRTVDPRCEIVSREPKHAASKQTRSHKNAAGKCFWNSQSCEVKELKTLLRRYYLFFAQESSFPDLKIIFKLFPCCLCTARWWKLGCVESSHTQISKLCYLASTPHAMACHYLNYGLPEFSFRVRKWKKK